MAFHSVKVLDSPLIGGKTLAKCRSFIFNVELNTRIGDTKELEDTFVMSDPRSKGHPFSADEDVVLMRWDIIKCNSVWLNSASSQFPNLTTTCSVEEMFVMSSVWHRNCRVDIIPRELWKFRKALESEILC